MGRSVAAQHPTDFVPHFALGQAKLGNPLLMIKRAMRSAWHSFGIVRRRRPDLVVSTGAGSQLFVVAWARLFGARIILVDSFARFERPSAFARLAGPLAHVRIAQSAAAGRNWPGALVYDPLREVVEPRIAKKNLLVATVGATLPFPRLVHLVIGAKMAGLITEEVILQTGDTNEPIEAVDGVTIVKSLPFDELLALLRDARIVVGHGGTGSIITALQAQCGTIVIPRRFELGEHYDNHQAEICEAFEARGLVYVADEPDSFAAALEAARKAAPRPVRTDYSGLVETLRRYVSEM
ncbi:MAG: glycosyltransferase [Alteraurantiacibacter sp.]